MNAIAIIPARGGSRRLPRKNVLSFAGKPLVEWSIIQARSARCLTDADIYLSTDDDEIAAIGERNNIQIIRRPDWPDADRRSAMPVYMHALGEIRKNRDVTHTFTLLPTSVCRHPRDLDCVLEAYKRFKMFDSKCWEVQMLTPRRETVLYETKGEQARIILWDKQWSYLGPGPTVEIKAIDWYGEHGRCAFYDTDAEKIKQNRRFIQRRFYYIPGRWYQAFDIDDQDMFELNEVLFKRYILKDRGEAVYWEYKSEKGN